MALITVDSTSWSTPLTLATDEIWQTRKGLIFLTSTASPAPEDGIEVRENQAVRLSAGTQIRYRKAGTTEALIVREAA